MTGLQRWRAADLPALVDRINKYSIGLDDYFDRLADSFRSPHLWMWNNDQWKLRTAVWDEAMSC